MPLMRRRLAGDIGRALLASSALALGLPVFAADSSTLADSTQATTNAAESDQKDTADPKHVVELGAVQVTAQSRKQLVEDVPISMNIVDAANIELHAATDLSKMSIFVPGLVVNGTAANLRPSATQPHYELRGIGGSGFGLGTDAAVGVYVDGVYATRSGGALMAFNDVTRIEVLKGPQGTLFGRNAAAGAISIVTNRPAIGQFEGSGRMRVGDHGTRWGNALLNIPVGQDMAFRLSAVDNQSDGWVSDAVTGKRYGKDDDWGTRASWLWNVGESTQLWLTWDHEHLNQPAAPSFGLIKLSDDPQQRPPFPPDPSTYLNPLHAPLLNDSRQPDQTRRFDGVTLHVDQSLSFGELSSISAFRRFKTFNGGDYDGTNHIVTYLDTVNAEDNRSWYQEFKLSGETRLTDWVTGASWYQENASQISAINTFTDSVDTLILNTGVNTGTPDGTVYHYFNSLLQLLDLPYNLLGNSWNEQIRNQLDYRSYALYGDVIWHLTDRLNLTTGLRYTRDRKEFSWFTAPRSAPQLDETIDALDAMGLLALAGVSPDSFRQNLIFNQAVGQQVNARNSWSDFSPRVVLDYHFTPDLMGYASVAKGYKAGGFDSVDVASHFEPEKMWNYEAGIKSVFPEQHLVFNASIYHYRYTDLQALTLAPNPSGSGLPNYLVSSSNEKATGVDAELQWQPVDALTLTATGTYINSRYGHNISANGTNLSDQPTGVPKYNFALGAQYIWPAMGGHMATSVHYGYRSKARCNDESQFQGVCSMSPNFKVGASQRRTDARISWSGRHFSVAAYGNNLTNNRYVIGVDNITATFGTPFADITPPRSYGVELSAKF